MRDRKGKGKEMVHPIKKERENSSPPCTNQVMNPPLSDNFRIPPISSYDGKGDPIIHIEDFQTHPSFYNILDETACQVFSSTLKEEAHKWFNGLEFVDSFSAIKRQFLDRFSAIHKKKQHPSSLFSLKQGQIESLTSFVRRFNQELQIVEIPSEEVILLAMINRMKAKEPLIAELAELAQGSTMCTLRQFTSRIEVYMWKEEAIKASEKTIKPLSSLNKIRREDESAPRKRKKDAKTKERDQHPNQRWTPLNTSLSAVFMEARKDPSFKPPPKMRTSLTKRNNKKYCE